MKVHLWTDGSGRSTGGPIGWAYVLRAVSDDGEVLRQIEKAGTEPEGTNNRAELLAIIHGLEALKRPTEVTVVSDSQYALGGYGAGWVDQWQRRGWTGTGGEPVKNRDLWDRLGEAIVGHTITWLHVDGHQFQWTCAGCGWAGERPAKHDCPECGEKAARTPVYPLNDRCDRLAGEARAAALGVLFDDVLKV